MNKSFASIISSRSENKLSSLTKTKKSAGKDTTLEETCDFGALKDQLIRDGIVCGVRENAVKRKLLQESKLTLEKCVHVCRATEATSARLKEMTPSQQQ